MCENNGNDGFQVENSITSSYKIFESMYDNNDIDHTVAEASLKADHDIFHSSLKTHMLTLKSCITFDQTDIEKALESAAQTLELCDKFRRRGFFRNLMKMVLSPDYEKYTELEMHAELTHAMCMANSAALGLINCRNFVELMRNINRFRISKNEFKECRQMFKSRNHWESDTSKNHFESGICLERGFRHLFISYFPPRLLKIVNFIGYRGVREKGFSEINKIAFNMKGYHSKLAEFILLCYYTYVEALGSVGKKHLNICNEIVDQGLKNHPENIAYLIFKAKSAQMNGEIDRAIIEFENLLSSDKSIFHKFSHWELLWCYALKCDWDQCIKYAELLRLHTLHSPAIATYIEGAFRYYKSYLTNDNKLKAQATRLLSTVPSLRVRYIGKTMTFEKTAVEYTKSYFKNNEFLFLPVLQMFYDGNMFYLIDAKNSLIEKHLPFIEKEMKRYLKDLDNSFYIDYYLDTLFYKAVILKHMRRLTEAQHIFKAIMKEKNRIEDLKCIIPQTLMELGFIQILLKNYDEAKVYLNQALYDYSGYLTENLVHVRIYSALREMGINTDNEDKIETDLNEYSLTSSQEKDKEKTEEKAQDKIKITSDQNQPITQSQLIKNLCPLSSNIRRTSCAQITAQLKLKMKNLESQQFRYST